MTFALNFMFASSVRAAGDVAVADDSRSSIDQQDHRLQRQCGLPLQLCERETSRRWREPAPAKRILVSDSQHVSGEQGQPGKQTVSPWFTLLSCF
jgi:hypothetical protein